MLLHRTRLFSVLRSFIDYPEEHAFTLDNLPFGCCNLRNRITSCTRIGNYVVDLTSLERNGLLNKGNWTEPFFDIGYLNKFMDSGVKARIWIRQELQNMFDIGRSANSARLKPYIIKLEKVRLLLPAITRDVTHFVTSEVSQTNINIARKSVPSDLLSSAFYDIPLGYNGRSSNLQTHADVPTPYGFLKRKKNRFGKSKLNDYSLGMGFYVNGDESQGPITNDYLEKLIFGYVLMNEWKAHDFDILELGPLGPLNSKYFATSISPWIITAEALQPFKVQMNPPKNPPSPHLNFSERKLYDISLKAEIRKRNTGSMILSESNMQQMYWSPSQLLFHQISAGTSFMSGDLIGTGTLSSKQKNGEGSLLEKTKNGVKPWTFGNSRRYYLKIDDEIILTGMASNGLLNIGFGESRSIIRDSSFNVLINCS